MKLYATDDLLFEITLFDDENHIVDFCVFK